MPSDKGLILGVGTDRGVSEDIFFKSMLSVRLLGHLEHKALKPWDSRWRWCGGRLENIRRVSVMLG